MPLLSMCKLDVNTRAHLQECLLLPRWENAQVSSDMVNVILTPFGHVASTVSHTAGQVLNQPFSI